MKKLNAWLITGFVCSFIIYACSAPQQPDNLKIGYMHEPPYSYVSEQGIASGIFPDTARQIAKKLGYTDITWVLLSLDNLLPALHEGRIDLIAAGMTNIPLRSEHACFATPLVTSKSAALWPKALSKFDPYKPLAEQNITYAVVSGSVEAIYLKKQVAKHRVLEIEDAFSGLHVLEQKQADVLLLTEPSLQYLAQINKDKYRVDTTNVFSDNIHKIAFVFDTQDKKLAERWNETQTSLMQTPSFSETVNNYALSIPSPKSRREPICDAS